MTTLGNYELKAQIAQGGFARIYQASHRFLDEPACIKHTRIAGKEYNDLLLQEAKILWQLNEHHSIPHSKDYFPLPDGSSAMVMDYIDGKPLDEFLPKGKRMHSEDASWIMERLLSALHYAHYKGVIHGDLKPSQVLIEPKKHDIKLIDFGLSVVKPTSGTKPLGYTEAYVSPEVIEGKTPLPQTDLYGAGVVFMYALGGDVARKTLPADVPEPLAEFCMSLLRYDPIKRPSWEKENLLDKFSDLREQAFGRRHSSARRK
ncbi:MAG: serine/threonine protein kinase [Nanoarchaeota archaeon]|nr:serine/threonine protein kinase [Nanoarchaeota archaeon]